MSYPISDGGCNIPVNPQIRTITQDVNELECILMDMSNIVNDMLRKIDGGVDEKCCAPTNNEPVACISNDLCAALNKAVLIRNRLDLINSMV